MAYRTALITGASSGIGRALALELARGGTRVALAARRRDRLEELREEIANQGGQALVAPMDVGDCDQTVRNIETIDDHMGGLDLIVANAGVGPPDRSAPLYRWESLRDPCHVNFCGAVATLTAVLPRMVERRSGHVAAISSLSALGALPDAAPYCSPKAGLSMLLDCLRIDLREHDVAVTTVYLGFVDTPMVAESTHPMPQLLSPEQAATHIAKALHRRPARIEYPQPLALGTRALAAVPRALRDRLVRALAR